MFFGCLFEFVGKNGWLLVDVDVDCLFGCIDLNGEICSFDVEDVLGMVDGMIYFVGFIVDEIGMYLFVDGYEIFFVILWVWC